MGPHFGHVGTRRGIRAGLRCAIKCHQTAILTPEANMQSNVKQDMRQLLDSLPDDVTWERLLDAIVLRHKIARGLADEAAGRVVSHTEFRREFGIGR